MVAMFVLGTNAGEGFYQLAWLVGRGAGLAGLAGLIGLAGPNLALGSLFRVSVAGLPTNRPANLLKSS